jgi:Ribbon-helix-helix protein, copG family
MMTIRFAGRQAVDLDILKLSPTEFTAMVNCGDILPDERACQLTRGAKRKEKRMSAESSSVRATISFPADLYQTLEEIAGQKKVSLAWVVREAAEQYIADKWPLFKGKV